MHPREAQNKGSIITIRFIHKDYISRNQQRLNQILVKLWADRPRCLLCCRCLCIAPSTGCLWLFVMDCKPWCRRTELPREPHPHIPPGDAPALHAARTLRSASLSCSPFPSLVHPALTLLPYTSQTLLLYILNSSHCLSLDATAHLLKFTLQHLSFSHLGFSILHLDKALFFFTSSLNHQSSYFTCFSS